MRKTINLEFRRKILHIVIGVIIILMAIFVSQAKWILLYAVILGIILSIASLYIKIPVLNFFLENFERPHYRKVFPGKGLLFFVAGSLLVLKIFPPNIALASIAILTFSDPFFSFDKRVFRGMLKIKNLRSLLLGLIAGTLAASFFISPLNALVAAVFAAIMESIAIFLGSDQVDDNIIIPLSAGTILYLIMP
jgi:dolichol kinase